MNYKTPDEHNRDREWPKHQSQPHPGWSWSGIGCPECGSELIVNTHVSHYVDNRLKKEATCQVCGKTIEVLA